MFDPPPIYGATLEEAGTQITRCKPTIQPDQNGVYQKDVCYDERLSEEDRIELMTEFDQYCPNLNEYDSTDVQVNNNRKKRSLGTRHEPQMRHNHSSVGTSDFQRRFAGHLTKSRDLSHSATELCTNMGSTGPNLYSYHEKRFCDLQKRKLYPVCEIQGQTECFDL